MAEQRIFNVRDIISMDDANKLRNQYIKRAYKEYRSNIGGGGHPNLTYEQLKRKYRREIKFQILELPKDNTFMVKEINIETIPVADRTESQHQELIKKYGGFRKYLLSFGKFKDVKI